jgi:hypothetical protein
MTRASSKEAFALTKHFNADAKSRKKILDFMADSKSKDWTRGEISMALTIPVNRVTPRVLELIQSGDIEELPRRKSIISHVECHALKLSEKRLKAMAA